MPFAGDSRSQSGPGTLILQHHQHEEAGQELDSRGSVLGCRVMHKRLELGHWVFDTDPLGGAAVGDIIGSLLWQRTKRRPISAMSLVFPAATSKDQPEAPKQGVQRTADAIGSSLRMVALRDENRQRDQALDVLDSGYPTRGGKSIWPKLPAADFIGVAVTGTNVNEQVPYFHPTDPRQIAANLGDAEIGSWICDLKGDVIDLERTARQQSAQRVVKLPTSPWVDFHGRNSAALQIGDSGSGDVRGGLTYDKDTGNSIAMWSQRQSGVVEHADGCTKHVLGTDADGHKIRSSHISLGAYFTDRAGTMDGPLDHRGALNVLPPKGPFKTDVVFYYHADLPHQFIGGVRRGRHRWHSYAFKYPVDDPGEPGKPPSGELIRLPGGEIVIHPQPDGAIGRRDGSQQPQPVEPVTPRRGSLGDIRSLPGLPGVDIETGAAVGPVGPVDLSGFDEFFDEFGRTPQIDLSGIEPITDGSGLAPATSGTGGLGFDDRPLIDLLGTDAETFTDAPDATGRQRRREGSTAAPLLRQQRAGDNMAPRSAEIWPATIGAILWRPAHYVSDKPDIRANRSYTQSDLDAYDRSAPVAIRQEIVGAQSGYSWNYTASPRAKSRTSPHPGGTVAGSMLFMPPERDAADYMIGSIPTRTTSTSYLALMDGVSLSLSAKISSGLPIDGLRVALTGSSDSKNASWTYLDASGSTRVGTLTHGGTIKPGGAAADLGALSDPWANLYATDGDFAGDVTIDGKLTVVGGIDPDYLQFTRASANAAVDGGGVDADDTLWVDDGLVSGRAAGTLMYGSTALRIPGVAAIGANAIDYTADDESVAYTGQDNAQGGTVYAKLNDLNALRTAVENLRNAVEQLIGEDGQGGVIVPIVNGLVNVGVVGAPPFSHADVFGADLVEMWRADTGVTKDGSDLVSSWVGSVDSTDLTASSTARPTWQAAGLGGQNALSFDGSTDFIKGAFGASQAQPMTYLIVMSISSWPSGGHLLDSDLGSKHAIWHQTGTGNATMYAGNQQAVGTTASWATGAALTGIFTFNTTTSYCWRNGTVIEDAGNVGTQEATQVCLGAVTNGTGFVTCKIAEVVVVGAVPTAAQMNSWLAYVQARYGISYTTLDS